MRGVFLILVAAASLTSNSRALVVETAGLWTTVYMWNLMVGLPLILSAVSVPKNIQATRGLYLRHKIKIGKLLFPLPVVPQRVEHGLLVIDFTFCDCLDLEVEAEALSQRHLKCFPWGLSPDEPGVGRQDDGDKVDEEARLHGGEGLDMELEKQLERVRKRHG